MSTTSEPTFVEYAEDDTDPPAADTAPPGVNDYLTDDDQVIDGEVTLPGNYADCRHAGREFTVRLTNRERVLWERAARKHEWGQATDSPHEALTFMAWQAARRDGDPAGALTFDQFVDQVDDVAGRQVARTRPTR
jgi:hypothetical protein